MTSNLQYVLDSAIQDRVTPGLVAGVFSKDKQRVYARGRVGYGSNELVTADTVYDLASLTKIFSTTKLCALAIDLGKLQLDEKPWPSWPGVTVAHVLNHSSGLPSWRPLYEVVRRAGEWGTSKGAELIVQAACHEKLIAAPGKQTLYSDLGFIALGALLEKRLRARLNELIIDVSHLRYSSKEVNDLNCAAMGGVAGHAGLFGNLSSVRQDAQFFLDALTGKQSGLGAIIRQFSEYPSERPLGFDCPTRGGSTGGYLSPRSRGHLGFTGTSVWIDPVSPGAIYILLTNRVHFTDRDVSGIQHVRVQFHRYAKQLVDQSF